MLNFVSSALLLTLVGVVSPQCITPNDNQSPPPHPDLGHILPFSLGLFKELYVPGSATGNFFFSPFSIWNALVLAYFGSAGTTRGQLQRVLNLKNPADTLATYKAVDRLYAERQANTSEYVIDLANRVYVDESFPLKECVRGILVDEVQNINFKQAPSAAKTINSFVSASTRGKIPSIVTAADVDNVPMVLVNAAYFKGFWLDKFELSATTKENFFPTPDTPTLVDMMKQTGKFKIGDSSELGATVLELPYKGKAASMFVVLPHSFADTTIDDVLARLNANTLQAALTNLRRSKVILSIPKFKLEQTIKDELKKALKRLGITDLFSSTADMSNYDETRSLVLRQGIHKAMVEALQRLGIEDLFTQQADLRNFDPDGKLMVRDGIHKAVVEVNEEGAEAAAVTAIIIGVTSVFQPPPPRVFKCDRPFLFFIHDNDLDNILFMGVYRQPQQ